MSHCGFTLPLLIDPPTANARLHWRKRAAMTASVRQTSAVIARSERNRLHVAAASKDDAPRKVHLTFLRPGQRGSHPVDGDALAAKGKPILDALQDAGWLWNDSPAYVIATYSQERTQQALSVAVEVTV